MLEVGIIIPPRVDSFLGVALDLFYGVTNESNKDALQGFLFGLFHF